jgi:glycosyltransferase involved in cell wall biosynthesis
MNRAQLTSAHVSSSSGLPITSVTVIIPAYNDETTVGRLISDVDCLLNEICTDYEIVCINDGSKDGTLGVLEQCAQRLKNVRIINHQVNQGYGKTIRELYYAGTKDLVFSLPGDYQFAPKELLTMAHGLKAHDLVIGWRVKRNDPWRRKLQSHIYNLMLRIFYGVSFKDVNSIKLFKREMLEHFPLESETPFVDAELCVRAYKTGFAIVEIPIEHLPRLTQGASGGKISVITDTFGDLIRMSAHI